MSTHTHKGTLLLTWQGSRIMKRRYGQQLNYGDTHSQSHFNCNLILTWQESNSPKRSLWEHTRTHKGNLILTW